MHIYGFAISLTNANLPTPSLFGYDCDHCVELTSDSLSQIASIEETLNQVCDCSFLYFYRDLIPVFVNHLYETNLKSSLLHDQSILSALSDPEQLLKQVRHVERDTATGATSCLTGYQNFVRNVLKEEYAAPICEMIETNLRYDLYCL